MAWLGQAGQSLLFSERKGRAVVGCAMRQRLCLVPSREKVPRYSSTGGSAKSRGKGPTCLRPLSLQGLERSWEKHRRKLHEEANKQYFVSLFLVELKPIFFLLTLWYCIQLSICTLTVKWFLCKMSYFSSHLYPLCMYVLIFSIHFF